MNTNAVDTATSKKKSTRKSAADATIASAAKTIDEKTVAPVKRKAARKSLDAAPVSPEERHHLVEVAAYYVAERRDFHGAASHEDWMQAEQEIDAMISAGKFAA